MGCVSCDNNVYTFQVKERSSIQLRLVFPMNASGEIQVHKILWINNAVRPGWVVPFSRNSPYRVSVQNETNVLLQDFVKSRSREIRIYTFLVTLNFDRQLDSRTAEILVTFQSDTIIRKSNLAASRLHGFDCKASYRLVDRGQGLGIEAVLQASSTHWSS